MMSRFSPALYLVLTFLAGALAGGFSHRLYTQNTVQATGGPDAYRQKYISEIRQRLSLTSDQIARLEVILDETRKRFREMHDRHKPEMQEIQNDQADQIRAILKPEQRAGYEQFREEREKLRRQRRGY